MELENFVKLFEVNGGQVLAYKDMNIDTGKENIVQMYKVDGVIIQAIVTFKTVEKRDDAFDHFDLAMATKFVDETIKAISR